MPELPEVETIARDLDRTIRGSKIAGFKVVNERTRRARPFLNLPKKKFRAVLLGLKVRRVSRRAKMLLIDFSSRYLLVHLKMTGQLVLIRPQKRPIAGGHPITGAGRDLPNKFTRAILDFSDGSRLYFNDVRRFGWLKLLGVEELGREFSGLGLEPLSQDFSLENFEMILGRKARTTIKQALFDQKYLAGVGNIYADESLYLAKIKPRRKAGSLSKAEIKRLWLAIPKVLKLAIKHRGTSFSDYLDGHGREGGFVKFLNVYGRAGEPCKTCGQLVRKMRLGDRGTHWCDHCQR